MTRVFCLFALLVVSYNLSAVTITNGVGHDVYIVGFNNLFTKMKFPQRILRKNEKIQLKNNLGITAYYTDNLNRCYKVHSAILYQDNILEHADSDIREKYKLTSDGPIQMQAALHNYCDMLYAKYGPGLAGGVMPTDTP